ncbi:hypothetical protein [Bacillus cereus]|uniref:hypothetical protein n=1 Tax=Bacillus cereus TaxID=1396 RepID=UPI0020D262A4|nr:hypothetical protein [Bacillus cereus]
MNEFLLNIFGSLAQLERGLTLQHQYEGIERDCKEIKDATVGGKKGEKAKQAIEWYHQEGKSVCYICKTLSIGTGTLH